MDFFGLNNLLVMFFIALLVHTHGLLVLDGLEQFTSVSFAAADLKVFVFAFEFTDVSEKLVDFDFLDV
jgi:hypothetical protein